MSVHIHGIPRSPPCRRSAARCGQAHAYHSAPGAIAGRAGRADGASDHVQVAPPIENDPGAIIEGSYTLTEDSILRVYDADRNLLGTERLKLGEDPARVARQLLRKKQGNGF